MCTTETVERLKSKEWVRAFGLMSTEEQECYREVGVSNCDLFTGGGWSWPYVGDQEFKRHMTYSIKAEYKLPPLLVYVPVEIDRAGRVCCTYNRDTVLLFHMIAQKNFVCFEYEGGIRCVQPRHRDQLDGPALIPKHVLLKGD